MKMNHNPGTIWRKYVQIREVNILIALIFMVVIMSAVSPYFLKQENIFNILRGMSTIGIMAIGQTMVIITGGIDLSVGSLMAVSSMLTARLITVHSQNALFAVICGLSFGLLLGTISGLIITRFKINPLGC
jgi:ribose transport system permease protein